MARLENTTVPESVAAAYTVEFLLELIELTESLIDSPALIVVDWPSMVIWSSLEGSAKVNVRWAELATVTDTW